MLDEQYQPITGPLADAAERAFRRTTPFVEMVRKYCGELKTDGLGRMYLEYEEMADPGEATLNCDVQDESAFTRKTLPLPITHSDIERKNQYGVWELIPRAEIDTAAKWGDFTAVEASARRVGEAVEMMFLGVGPAPNGFAPATNHFGTHGVLTHPDRSTMVHNFKRSKTHPEFIEAGAAEVVGFVEKMVGLLKDKNFYGPHDVVYGHAWDAVMDQDGLAGGERGTVRDDVLRIGEDIKDNEKLILACKRSDYLPDDTISLVQMTLDVVRVVEGQPICIVPHENGYKVLTITVPQIRSDAYGNCGIVDARSFKPMLATRAASIPKSEWLGADKPVEVHVNTRGCEPMQPETAEALARAFKAVKERYYNG